MGLDISFFAQPGNQAGLRKCAQPLTFTLDLTEILMASIKASIFGETWVNRARGSKDPTSWVRDVMATLDTTGSVYLASLRLWFNRFPVSAKQKHGLITRIESFNNQEHLGAVNELAWWTFLQRQQFKAAPIATTKNTSTPDFRVVASSEFFAEVSTLNISEKDQAIFLARNSIELDHSETLRRVLGKVTAEKLKQLSYATERRRPSVLVLFDYTTWSAFGTQFYQFLADFLLGKNLGFQNLPVELSALVYVERKVFNGHIAISRPRSATYYNPFAKYPLPLGTFTSLNQFWCQMVKTESVSPDDWVWL